MSQDEFSKLFSYVEKRFDEMESRLDKVATKEDVKHLRDTVIDFAERLDTYSQEMAAMQHKIDRLEKYIQIIAEKAGVDLNAVRV